LLTIVLVVVKLDIVPVAEVRRVIVPDAEERSEMVAFDIVVVASALVPVTTKVLVVVALADMKLSIIPVRA
jgi:hypothetical protein